MTTAVVLGVGLDDRKQLCLCSLDCDAKRMWPPISKSGGTEADPGTDSAIYIQTLTVFWAPTCILFSVNAFGELKSSTHTHTYTHTETSSTPLKPKKFTMGATHNHTMHTHAHTCTYLQPVSLRRLMELERSRTQPRKPAPCFLWIFLWFHTLIVMESNFPMYLYRHTTRH